jgi:hypothetical protein
MSGLGGYSCINDALQGCRPDLALSKLQPKMYFMYHDRHLWSLRNVETGPAYGSAPDGSI